MVHDVLGEHVLNPAVLFVLHILQFHQVHHDRPFLLTPRPLSCVNESDPRAMRENDGGGHEPRTPHHVPREILDEHTLSPRHVPLCTFSGHEHRKAPKHVTACKNLQRILLVETDDTSHEPRDPRHMLYGVLEEDEVHRRRRRGVVVLEVLREEARDGGELTCFTVLLTAHDKFNNCDPIPT